MHISAVKFASLLQEFPYRSVVKFPSFGSEGRGVELPQGNSCFYICVGLQLFFFVQFSFFIV